ncbi:hypothetical protein Tco_0760015 [Tanacetum coccineum]
MLTKELSQDMKHWEELIRENVFGLGGHRDHLPASLAHMLYCIVPKNNIILLISLSNESNVLGLLQPPIFLMASRHSVSSTSAHHNLGSSSHQGDDDEDDGASRASAPSLTTYLNSLKSLNYQPYKVPTSSKQNDDLLFERQTELLNQSQEIDKEVRGGFKSFGKALRDVFGKKKK